MKYKEANMLAGGDGEEMGKMQRYLFRIHRKTKKYSCKTEKF